MTDLSDARLRSDRTPAHADPTPPRGRLAALHEDLTRGRIDRRRFLAGASALGVSGGAIATILANTPAMAQTPGATPAGTPAGTRQAGRPTGGTEGQARGEAGDLRILVPQAASALSVHNATGGKDIAAGSIVSEPLLAYGPDAGLLPVLAAEVPSIENGLLAPDLSSVTFRLLPGVLWSDGQPLTAEDVVFTWAWNVDPANGSIDAVSWELVAAAEAIDELTVRLDFAQPTLGWFQPFGSNIGVIYPRHLWEGRDAAEANTAFLTAPVGTAPSWWPSSRPTTRSSTPPTRSTGSRTSRRLPE